MREMIEFTVFDAGLNTKADPVNLLKGQSYDMNNIIFGDYGSIDSRRGVSTHNTVQMGNGTYGVRGLGSYRPSTMSAQMIAIAGQAGGMFVLTGASTAPVSISGTTGLYNAPTPVQMEQMNEKMFLVGEGMNPTKWNGTELTVAGVFKQTQILSAVSNAGAGNITGEYQYVYWGVNSYAAEGDYIDSPSPVKTFAAAKVRVSNIPTAPAIYGISYWKIGRNTAGAAGLYWYLTDVSNGVTSFTDNVADSSLDVLAPSDQGYPRQFVNICSYAGRMWGCIGDYLWYSNTDQPEEFPSTNFIRVGKGMGLSITAIVPFMGMIVISLGSAGATQLYVLRIGDSVGFNDPQNWYLNLIADDMGSESHRSCIPMAGYLWLTSRNGVALFDGAGSVSTIQDTSSGGAPSKRISDPVRSLFESSYPENIKMSCAIVWKDRVYISLSPNQTVSGIPDANSKIIVYDYMRVGNPSPAKGAWSVINNIGVSKFIIHEGNLYGGGYGSAENPLNTTFRGGYIVRLDNGNKYDTVAGVGGNLTYPSYNMAPIRGNQEHVLHDKDFRFINVWASGTGLLTAELWVDGLTWQAGSYLGTQSITLTANGTKTKLTLPGGFSGKHLWIKFQATDVAGSPNVDLSITRVQVFYNLRGLRNA